MIEDKKASVVVIAIIICCLTIPLAASLIMTNSVTTVFLPKVRNPQMTLQQNATEIAYGDTVQYKITLIDMSPKPINVYANNTLLGTIQPTNNIGLFNLTNTNESLQPIIYIVTATEGEYT